MPTRISKKISLALSYDDVLLVPQKSNIDSRTKVDLSVTLTPKVKLKIPLISANMSDVTDAKMAIKLGRLGALGVLPRFLSINDQVKMVKKVKKENLVIASSVGIRNGMLKRADALVNAVSSVLFLDVAHGHMQKNIDATRMLKRRFGKNVDIISGNVATFEGANDLFKSGADSVKVGVGPGSICTTRIETGSGVPQITAIMECVKAAKNHNKTIIADGGIKNAGDIVKALAAGASAIMAGSLFAGSTEAPGKKIKVKGKYFKNYFASTSFSEKKKHMRRNGFKLGKNYKNQIEGVESIVPFKGPVENIVLKLTCNIKSGLSYSGAKNISELWNKAKFVQITTAGMRESGAHDVTLLN